ncbi:MAG TPA: hypothetical protein VE033_04745, partial [Acetobacteraceae bacterium]|nr:hypothetical protein [Acetobacteraceae bacterium]
APRFHGAAGRLLVEGQRTNLIRNPRGEGVAPGTRAPGAQTDPATNWRLVNRGSGLSLDVSAISADGMTGLRLRYHGTTGASPATETLEFDTRNGIAAPAGTVLTGSFLWRLAAGTLPQGSFQMGPRIVTLNASAAFVDLAYSPAAHPDATLRRSAHTMTAGAGVVNAVVGMHLQTFPASTALDFTIDVFWPQLEAAPFASTPILPPAGTPGASTRGADTVTAPFGTLFPSGAGTVLVSCMVPQAAASGLDQTILHLDDGTLNNRFRLYMPNSSTAIVGARSLAGTQVVGTQAGATVPGTPFAVGISFDGTGRMTYALAGGAVQSVTGGPAAGLTTLRVGTNAAGAAAIFGQTTALDVLPHGVPATTLAGLVGAMNV